MPSFAKIHKLYPLAYALSGSGKAVAEGSGPDVAQGSKSPSLFALTYADKLQKHDYPFGSSGRQNVGLLVGVDGDVAKHLRLSLDAHLSLFYPLHNQFKERDGVHLRNISFSVAHMF